MGFIAFLLATTLGPPFDDAMNGTTAGGEVVGLIYGAIILLAPLLAVSVYYFRGYAAGQTMGCRALQVRVVDQVHGVLTRVLERALSAYW